MATRRRVDNEDEMMAQGDDDDEQQTVDESEVRYMRRPSRVIDDHEDEDDDQIIPDRVMRIILPKPWNKLRIFGWFDYPKELAEKMNTPEDESPEAQNERIYGVLREVIVRHDNWKFRNPETGRIEVLPQPDKRAFWDAIPNALAAAIIKRYFEMVRTNPTPQAAPRKTSRR